jgi:S-adenosylmethionine:tRNA ribosyltransferase-isomerase
MTDDGVLRLDALAYELPPELIAQEPCAERGDARMLWVDRGNGTMRDAHIADLGDALAPGDLLVVNDARVVPARVRGHRPSGGRLELLLLDAAPDQCGQWTALVRGSPRVGERVGFPDGSGEWTADLGGGRWRIRLDVSPSVPAWLERVGEVPLPPYIRRPAGPTAADAERYQTMFARVPGAVAAPTAGLHFTPELLRRLDARGVGRVALTLHVGPGTFLPIRDGDLATYAMEGERYELPAATADAIAAAKRCGGRVIAVGTTTTRALEAAGEHGFRPGADVATIFIRPGHRFRVVDALLTNFHLPRTPLLALVAAFAGWDLVRHAYELAVERRYRFYSYGDAMLLT